MLHLFKISKYVMDKDSVSNPWFLFNWKQSAYFLKKNNLKYIFWEYTLNKTGDLCVNKIIAYISKLYVFNFQIIDFLPELYIERLFFQIKLSFRTVIAVIIFTSPIIEYWWATVKFQLKTYLLKLPTCYWLFSYFILISLL